MEMRTFDISQIKAIRCNPRKKYGHWWESSEYSNGWGKPQSEAQKRASAKRYKEIEFEYLEYCDEYDIEYFKVDKKILEEYNYIAGWRRWFHSSGS